MSSDYVDRRIREALRLHGSNDAKTKKQIHAWLYEDHKFVLELMRPHMNGIIAYALTRTKNRLLEEHQASKMKHAPQQQEAQASTATEKEEGFGETILRSFVSERAARFGYESSAAPIRRKAASQTHIDTMHLLAAASKNKDKQNPDDEGQLS